MAELPFDCRLDLVSRSIDREIAPEQLDAWYHDYYDEEKYPSNREAWYRDYYPDEEYQSRCAQIISNGLPCQLNFSDDTGFVRVDLELLPGWIDLAYPTALARERACGWTYHVSFGKDELFDDA